MFPSLRAVLIVCCGALFVLTACGGPQKATTARTTASAKDTSGQTADTKSSNKDAAIKATADVEAPTTTTINVTTAQPCKVMLINHEDVTDDLQFGWWDVWHARKGGDQYFDAPHTFTDVKPGKYILIVHMPYADLDDNGSDGAVIEDLTIGAQPAVNVHFEMTDFVDWNCLSCPWLYIFDGQKHVRAFEILKDVVGRHRKTTRAYPLPENARHQGRVSLRIQEEKDEITHLDHLELRVGDRTLTPRVADDEQQRKLQTIDDDVVLLTKGDVLNVEFDLPADLNPDAPLSLVATGHYVPDRAMLAEAFHRLQRRP